MTDEDEACRELARWADSRGMDADELMNVCAAMVGRVVRAHGESGTSFERMQELAQSAQWRMFEGAGITGGGDEAKH